MTDKPDNKPSTPPPPRPGQGPAEPPHKPDISPPTGAARPGHDLPEAPAKPGQGLPSKPGQPDNTLPNQGRPGFGADPGYGQDPSRPGFAADPGYGQEAPGRPQPGRQARQFSDEDERGMDLESKAKINQEIQNNPERQDPNLPIEAQMIRTGFSTPPIKDEYAPNPPESQIVTSTHDRDSVQPPGATAAYQGGAPPMPLKKDREAAQPKR